MKALDCIPLRRWLTAASMALLCFVKAPAAFVGAPPSHPLQDALVYFMMVDRFEDGDPANNYAGQNPALGQSVHGHSPANMMFYLGGDLAGVRQRLDYLQNLGVSHIWTTPVFRNKWVQGSSAGFHGYWITDFLNVDPHLGTNADLEHLAEDLRQRGMGLFLDIVANHTADVIQYQENNYNYRGLAAPAYTPVVPANQLSAKNPGWLNDPQYYHNRGNSTFAGESSIYGDFFGLDDLATAHPRVVEGMIEIYADWIRRLPLAGFRIDTVKHVHGSFWREFSPAIRAAAQRHGRDGFFQFGEVWSGDTRYLSEYSTWGELDATLDFGFAYAARAFVSQQQTAAVFEDLFDRDDWYRDPWRSADLQPTFLENHDGGMGRWTWFLRNDNPGISEERQIRLYKLGHALLLFARGIPVLYYGSEQGFAGGGSPDARAREPMFPSKVADYNAGDLLGTNATTAASNFDTGHPLYLALREINTARQLHPALRRGAQLARPSGDSRVLAYARIDRDELREYLVVANNSLQDAVSVTLQAATPDTGFVPVYDSESGIPTVPQVGFSSDADGRLQVTVPAASLMVLRAERVLPARSNPPEVQFAGLQTGGTLAYSTLYRDWQAFPPRVLIEAQAPGLDHGEVSFSMSRSSRPGEVKLLGVDDNPPYRVAFHLPEDLQPDETLELRATVNDLRGGFASVVAEQLHPRQVNHLLVHLFLPTGSFDGWSVRAEGEGVSGGEVNVAFIGEVDTRMRFAFVPLDDPTALLRFRISGPNSPLVTDQHFQVIPVRVPEVYLHPEKSGFCTTAASVREGIRLHVKSTAGGVGSVRVKLEQWHGSHRLWQSGELSPNKSDGYGAVFEIGSAQAGANVYWQAPLTATVRVADGSSRAYTLDPRLGDAFWLDAAVDQAQLSLAEASGEVWIHYHRPDANYGNTASANFNDFWGLHLWDGAASPSAGWTMPQRPAQRDAFGLQFRVPVLREVESLAYILHRGDSKDPGFDQFLDPRVYGHRVWQVSGADAGEPYVKMTSRGGFKGSFADHPDAGRSLQLRWLGGSLLQFDSLPGRIHHIEASDNLRDWSPISDPVHGSGAVMNVDLNTAAPPRFWRVRLTE